VCLVSLIVYKVFANPFFIVWIPYVLLPVLDYLLPVDHNNLKLERIRLFEKDKRFLIPLYSVWILDFLIYFIILAEIYQGKICQTPGDLFFYALCFA
jgi:hypothetical protein